MSSNDGLTHSTQKTTIRNCPLLFLYSQYFLCFLICLPINVLVTFWTFSPLPTSSFPSAFFLANGEHDYFINSFLHIKNYLILVLFHWTLILSHFIYLSVFGLSTLRSGNSVRNTVVGFPPKTHATLFCGPMFNWFYFLKYFKTGKTIFEVESCSLFHCHLLFDWIA